MSCDCDYCKIEASIRGERIVTTVKPDRAPPRLLSDTTDGVHFAPIKPYIRQGMNAWQQFLQTRAEIEGRE